MNITSILVIFLILIIFIGIVIYLYENKDSELESKYIKGFMSKLPINSEPTKQDDKGPLSNSEPTKQDDKGPLSNSEPKKQGPLSNSEPKKQGPLSNPEPKKQEPNSKQDENQSTLDKILDTTKGIVSDPNLYVAIGTDVVLRELVKKSVNKVSQKIIAKFAYKAEELFLKTTGKVLEKMGLDKGGEYLAKLGLKAGEKAGQKAAEALALKAAIKGGEAGGTLAAQSAAAAATGPAAPFVEAAMLAFDVLSIGLDLADALIPGGTVGYSKMGTIQQYQEMRDGIMKEMKKAFEAQGSTFPSVVGPLDKLTSDEYKSKLTIEIKNIMDTSKDPIDPLFKPMVDKITEDIKSKKLSDADTNDDAIMDTYLKLIDMDKITEKATNNLCINLNGKNVDVGNGKIMCSYPDRNTCETSYTWPLKEDSNETYAEFKNNLYGGSCVTASYALRGICQSNNLPYDSELGICKIDENYCKSKGADWIYNDNIKAYDCGINQGQNIAELLFGTTITRGLKQIFDPAQYEKCKPGEFNNPYSCSGCNQGEEVNNDLNIAAAVLTGPAGAATLGTLGGLNMCYPKCKSGFHPFGANICSPDCESGWTDDGAFCRKAGICPDPDNMDHNGALCYTKCKSGFHPFGTNICSPDCESGWTDDGAFCRKAGVCENNMDHNSALCYPKCNSGYTGSGPLCWENCPDGYKDLGAFCSKGGDVYPKSSRPADKKGCDAGQRDDGTNCWVDTYGNSVGYVPKLNACPSGSHDVGGTCWSNDDGHCDASTGGGCHPCTGGDTSCPGGGPWYNVLNCHTNPIVCPGCDPIVLGACHPSYVTKNIGDRGNHCDGDDQNIAGLCYKKCKSGFHYAGGNLCAPDGHIGGFVAKDLSSRLSCHSDENNVAGICWKKCNDGYHDDGAFCRKDIQTTTKKSYGRGVGVPDTLIKGKPNTSYGRGVGVPDTYIKAKPNTAYGRGVGHIANTRVKKRVAAYSTKDN